MLEAESTGNFDTGIGTASLSWFVPLLRAQLLTVQGRYEEAIALFDVNIQSAGAQGVARLLVSFLADSAWCKFKLGRDDEAAADVARCLDAAANDCDADDLAASLARVARILDATGETERAHDLRANAEAARETHSRQQVVLLELLLNAMPDGRWSTELP
jgi:tetratricopeptide (TPR) repeat protein